MDRMALLRICSRTAEVGGAVLCKGHPRFMVRFTGADILEKISRARAALALTETA